MISPIGDLDPLPVLIVCYRRPRNLETLLNSSELTGRRIYVFIDRSVFLEDAHNIEVQTIAGNKMNELDLRLLMPIRNFGVEEAVPFAINWVFKSESEVIILEDDCLPVNGALKNLDSMKCNLQGQICMISMFSPFLAELKATDKQLFWKSKYPLIWGWATNKNQWSKINKNYFSGFELFKLYFKSFKANQIKPEVPYFISAVIRSQAGLLKSWDSHLALSMITKNLTALVPNFSLTDYRGYDEMASHTLPGKIEMKEFIQEMQIPLEANMEYVIEKNIYELSFRHLLSPIKSMFLVCINKLSGYKNVK